MYTNNKLTVAAIIAFVITNTQNQTTVWAADLSPAQVNVLNGVFKQQHWRGLWFESVGDEEDWTHVDSLFGSRSLDGATRKLQMIPVLMGCEYGAGFSWFLSSSIHTIDECDYLWRNQDANAYDCWDKLRASLERGSLTILKVMSTLVYIHHAVGDDIDFDEFYKTLLPIRSFLDQIQFAGASQDDFAQLFNDVTDRLHRFLISNCRPDYEPFDLEAVMDVHDTMKTKTPIYNLYVSTTDGYIKRIDNHLTLLGFHYSVATGQTTFVPDRTL